MLNIKTRSNLRSLMIMVAIVAGFLWAAKVYSRWTTCRQAAKRYYDYEKEELYLLGNGLPMRGVCGVDLASRSYKDKRSFLDRVNSYKLEEYQLECLLALNHYAKIRRQFEHAAWRFWEPLPAEDLEPRPLE